ncbi:MAG: hypothetical protein ACOYOP_03800 [Microthrixaceae bacterium]
MTATAALGALATLVSVAFCLSTLERWRANRKPHEWAWTVSMAMFASASAAYFVAAGLGWGPWDFRAFYLFGAILNVPYLALGTVYLLGGVVLGDRVRFWLNLTAAFCAGVVLTAPILAPLDVEGIPSGREVFGAGPRIMAAVGSGVGALVLIGGALWSAVRLVRVRRAMRATTSLPSRAASGVTPGRLVVTNVLIALGSLVLGTGGTLFGSGDAMQGFGIALAVGVTLLFVGFLVSNPTRPTAAPSLSPYWREVHDLASAA